MKGFEQTGELLMRLCEVGRPRLSRMNEGWHCAITFPAPEGVTAEVQSDFGHKTPEEALQCCIDRLGGLRNMIAVKSPAMGNVAAIEGQA